MNNYFKQNLVNILFKFKISSINNLNLISFNLTSSIVNLSLFFHKNFKFFIKINILILLILFSNLKLVNADNPQSDLPPLPTLEGLESNDMKTQSVKDLKPLKSPSFFQRIKNIFGKKQEEKLPSKDFTKKSPDEEHEPFIDLGTMKLPEVKNEEVKDIVEIPKDFQNQQPHIDVADNNKSIKDIKTANDVVNKPLDNGQPQHLIADSAQNTNIPQLEIPKIVEKLPVAEQLPSVNQNDNVSVETTKPVTVATINDANAKQVPVVAETTTQAPVIELDKPILANEPPVLEVPTLPVIPTVPNTAQNIDVKQTQAQTDGTGIEIAQTDVTNDISSEQSKFVIDEAKVLLLPNDEVVLGELTEVAKNDQLDFFSYIDIYKQQQNYFRNIEKRSVIENFIRSYDDNFNQNYVMSSDEYKSQAINAINNNNLFQLKALMNNFPLLQATDSNGNTLLHLAATDNNYQLVKFLIMRGVNLTALNNNVETALTISEMENNQAISNILKQAGAR